MTVPKNPDSTTIQFEQINLKARKHMAKTRGTLLYVVRKYFSIHSFLPLLFMINALVLLHVCNVTFIWASYIFAQLPLNVNPFPYGS